MHSYNKRDYHTESDINKIVEDNKSKNSGEGYTQIRVLELNAALCKTLTQKVPDYKKAMRELETNTLLHGAGSENYKKTKRYFENKIHNRELPIKCDTPSELVMLASEINNYFSIPILLYSNKGNHKEISLDDFETLVVTDRSLANFVLELTKDNNHLSTYRTLFSLERVPYDKIKETIINKKLMAISQPKKDITQKEFADLKIQVQTLKEKLGSAENKIENLELEVKKLKQKPSDTNAHSSASTKSYSPRKFS